MSLLDTLMQATGFKGTTVVTELRAEDYIPPVPQREPLDPAPDEEMSTPGLKPRVIHTLGRLHDVKDAIDSAIEAGIDPEPAWIEEMRDLMNELGLDET